MHKDAKRWIEDTQMFQRIVGTKVTSDEILLEEWNSFNKKRKNRELVRTSDHLIIAKAARKAGEVS